MKRAANKTGGGGGVALWQPALITAAPCCLIFPDHRNNPFFMLFFSFCGRKLVRFYGRKAKLHVVVGVIKSINFRVYLIASDQTHFVATVVFPL